MVFYIVADLRGGYVAISVGLKHERKEEEVEDEGCARKARW